MKFLVPPTLIWQFLNYKVTGFLKLERIFGLVANLELDPKLQIPGTESEFLKHNLVSRKKKERNEKERKKKKERNGSSVLLDNQVSNSGTTSNPKTFGIEVS